MAPDEPPPLPRDWLAPSTAIVGIVQLGLALSVATWVFQGDVAVSRKIGLVVGATFLWPAIALGAVALFKSGRNPRSRCITLLVVWGLFALTHLSALAAVLRAPAVQRQARQPATAYRASGKKAGDSPASIVAKHVNTRKKFNEGRAPVDVHSGGLDFSEGSHERLAKRIEKAQESHYREILGHYDTLCDQYPDDVRLALERVQFIERFLNAEDIVIANVEKDHATARAHLMSCFPTHPSTILYDLETTHGPEFETKAEKYDASRIGWSQKEIARFFLLRAQRTPETRGDAILRHAERSFINQATVEAGVLVAQQLKAQGKKKPALQILNHRVFESARVWSKRQVMELLFELDEPTRAVRLYRELLKEQPFLVQTMKTVEMLASCGQIGLARELIARLPSGHWNARKLDEERFRFELKYGNDLQALAAYRTLRAHGVSTDPLARERARLFIKDPFAGWALGDAFGVFGFLLFLALSACMPLALLAPAHYWSLLCQRSGRVYCWTITPWGLRSAWGAAGILCVALALSSWLFNYEALAAGFSKATQSALDANAPLKGQLFFWSALAPTVLILLWGFKAWRVLGNGKWSLVRCLFISAVGFVMLRLFLGYYLIAFPAANPLAALSPTMILLQQMQKTLGPLITLLMVGLMVPVLEEVIFRGLLLGALAKHVPFWAANATQSVCFALMHDELKLAPFFIALSVLAAWFTRSSRGLLPAILLHAFNNICACLLLPR